MKNVILLIAIVFTMCTNETYRVGVIKDFEYHIGGWQTPDMATVLFIDGQKRTICVAGTQLITGYCLYYNIHWLHGNWYSLRAK